MRWPYNGVETPATPCTDHGCEGRGDCPNKNLGRVTIFLTFATTKGLFKDSSSAALDFPALPPPSLSHTMTDNERNMPSDDERDAGHHPETSRRAQVPPLSLPAPPDRFRSLSSLVVSCSLSVSGPRGGREGSPGVGRASL